MTKAMYTEDNGVARKVKSQYTDVELVARKVTKGYVEVDNVARQFFETGFIKWIGYDNNLSGISAVVENTNTVCKSTITKSISNSDMTGILYFEVQAGDVVKVNFRTCRTSGTYYADLHYGSVSNVIDVPGSYETITTSNMQYNKTITVPSGHKFFVLRTNVQQNAAVGDYVTIVNSITINGTTVFPIQ